MTSPHEGPTPICIDLEHLRQKPDLYRQAIAKKGIALDLDQLLAIDNKLRQTRQELDGLRAERNKITALVTQQQITKEEAKEQAQRLADALKRKEHDLAEEQKRLSDLAARLPGLPSADTPEGATDNDNLELYRRGEAPIFDFAWQDHTKIMLDRDWVDFEGARLAAGSRAYALRGDGVLLELAILRLAFDLVIARGFTPVAPPLMVREAAMFGTGYFPFGEDSAYHNQDKHYLTGTAEVGIMATQTGKLLKQEDLSRRYVGMTTCFRREAGAAGRDVKGLYRVHQFQKVEQIVISTNDVEASQREHQALLQNAQDILQLLELPYRVVAVCAGDMGLGQVRKHDIETWMPSRKAYGETHSCSTFHDFQSRRLNLRYRDNNGTKQFAHTLNNTAIASPRILIAFLENHQKADGTIHVPEALRPYLAGRSSL